MAPFLPQHYVASKIQSTCQRAGRPGFADFTCVHAPAFLPREPGPWQSPQFPLFPRMPFHAYGLARVRCARERRVTDPDTPDSKGKESRSPLAVACGPAARAQLTEGGRTAKSCGEGPRRGCAVVDRPGGHCVRSVPWRAEQERGDDAWGRTFPGRRCLPLSVGHEETDARGAPRQECL